MLQQAALTVSLARRYILQDNVITSAGVTAGIDAALFLIEQMTNPQLAQETCAKMQYTERITESDPRGKEEKRPPNFNIGKTESVRLVGRTVKPWGKAHIAVAVLPGVSETLLGAVVDCFPRTGKVKLVTFTVEDSLGPVWTKHHVAILPQMTAADLKNPKVRLGAGELGNCVVEDSPTSTARDLCANQQFICAIDLPATSD